MENFAKIGVDGWSILIYIINYGLLFVIIGWLLYTPVRKMMNERKKIITDNIHEAEHLRDEMEVMMKKQEKERKESLQEIQTEKKALEKLLAEKKQTLLAEMEKERSTLLEQTRAQIAEEKEKIISGVEGKILSIIKKALFSIMAYQVPEEVVKGSVKKAWEEQKKV